MKKITKRIFITFCIALFFLMPAVSTADYGNLDRDNPFHSACAMLRKMILNNWNDSFDINRYKYTDINGDKVYGYSLTLPFDDCNFYDRDSNSYGYLVVDSNGQYFYQDIVSKDNPIMKDCVPVTLTIQMYYTPSESTKDNDPAGTKYYLLKTFVCGPGGNGKVVYTKDRKLEKETNFR